MFFHRAAEGALPVQAKPGALLSVLIRFHEREAEFRIHARVVARCDRSDAPEEHGLRLEFLPEEQKRRDLVLAWAEGDSVPYRRRHSERISCMLKARVKVGRQEFRAFLTNISARGGYLISNCSLKEEAVVSLELSFSRNQRPFCIRGRVTSIIPEGAQSGYGIEFLFESAEQRADLSAEIARLSVTT